MDESTRAQDAARQAQEAGSRRAAQAQEAAKDTARVAGQLAGLGTETFTVWTDATQHAWRNVLDLSSRCTQETAHQLSDWQQANAEVLREMQTNAMRWATLWPEFFRDPIRGYQRSLEESIESSHRVIELTRRRAEALAQSCQRLERAAEDATRTLGETFRSASTKMQDVYTRTERARVA
jgi:hypothetical protein